MVHQRSHYKEKGKELFRKPTFHLLITLFFIIVSFLLVAFLQSVQDIRQRAVPTPVPTLEVIQPSADIISPPVAANSDLTLIVRLTDFNNEVGVVRIYEVRSTGDTHLGPATLIAGTGQSVREYQFILRELQPGTHKYYARAFRSTTEVTNTWPFSSERTIQVANLQPATTLNVTPRNARSGDWLTMDATVRNLSSSQSVTGAIFFRKTATGEMNIGTSNSSTAPNTIRLRHPLVGSTESAGGTFEYKAVPFINGQQQNDAASPWVRVVISANPFITIATPISNFVIKAGTNVTFSATLVQPVEGTITEVQFMEGTSSRCTATTPTTPSCQWSNVSAGVHVITAKETIQVGGVSEIQTSDPVQLFVPRIVNTTVGPQTANQVTLNATVEFNSPVYTGTVKFYKEGTSDVLCEDNTSPYSCSWTNATAGTHAIVAKLFSGIPVSEAAVSAAVSLQVNAVGSPSPLTIDIQRSPSGTITVPNDVALTTNVLTGSLPADSSVRYSWSLGSNGQDIGSSSNTAGNFPVSWDTEGRTAGTYTITAKVYSGSTYTGVSDTVDIPVQTATPPGAATITLSRPLNEQNYDSSITIEANVQNVTAGMVIAFKYQNLRLGQPTIIKEFTVPSSNPPTTYTENWSPTTTSGGPGPYKIIAEVYRNNELLDDDSVNILIGGATLVNRTPATGHIINGPITLTVHVYKSKNSAGYVKFLKGGTAIPGCERKEVSAGVYTSPITCSWSGSAVTAGQHTDIKAQLFISGHDDFVDEEPIPLTVNAIATVSLASSDLSGRSKTDFYIGDRFLLKTTVTIPTTYTDGVRCIQIYYRKEGREPANEFINMGSAGKTCTSTSTTANNIRTYTFSSVGVDLASASEGRYDFKAIAFSDTALQNNLGESAPLAINVTERPEPTEDPNPDPTDPPSATNTPAPTNTLTPGNVAFNFKLLHHGIGKAGDNVTPGRGGNMTPLRSQRTITFEVYNSSEQLVTTKEGTVTFNSTDGNFTGKIDAGTLPAGSYALKVRSNQSLKKRINGLQVANGSEVNAEASLVTGDITGDTSQVQDNKINILDYNMILDCYADLEGPRNCTEEAKKQKTDLTDDGKVDLFDMNLFLRELSSQEGD